MATPPPASAHTTGANRRWTFLTNHARVLIAIAGEPDLRVRDLADRIGITERTTQGILQDLEREGFVDKNRTGRRNTYAVHPDLSFRHPLESGHEVGELLRLFVPDGPASWAPAREVRGGAGARAVPPSGP